MKFTDEQIEIINTNHNILVNAVAGSGKTTTIVSYAQNRPPNSKILYLAFNKSVKLEAVRKFEQKGLYNVNVETAHSLAYKYIVSRSKYEVAPNGYKNHEIVEKLGLQDFGEKHNEYVIASYINKFVAYFCNSDKEKMAELDYLSIINEAKAKEFVNYHYNTILRQSREFMAKMNAAELPITHDFYLKKFQLLKPQLGYDYILFDEGQDASPAMLDVFLNQNNTIKVIVGDTHQQIYSWRFAVNSLEKVDFDNYKLSKSFRFRQEIALLGMEALQLKKKVSEDLLAEPVLIFGLGGSDEKKSKAVIARTNLGLLTKAIELVYEEGAAQNIYFEGNINSYTYADEGTSLYDVLGLYNGDKQRIRDPLLRMMKDLEELEAYIKKTEDMQLSMMLELVKQYGNRIPSIINYIKEKHLQSDKKEEAEMIFSTVHRCKGMEYDEVYLVDDFITKDKIESYPEDYFDDQKNVEKINEEINLLYVAITRTRNILHIQNEYLTLNFQESPRIITGNQSDGQTSTAEVKSTQPPTHPNAFYKEKIQAFETKSNQKNAYKLWTDEEDDELLEMESKGKTILEMAKHFGRSKSAIEFRLEKLMNEDDWWD
jgi:F-box protein, helicase, 18